MSGMTAKHARFTAARSLVTDNPLLLAIAGIGFAVSFQTIARLAAEQHMPGWPVLYPLLIDVGFLGAIVEARRAIDDGRSDAAPRALAWLLGALTVYVNAHGSPAGDWLGMALHVAGPVLWIAFLELTRWRKVRRTAADRIPVARWAFMPARTLGMRKRMIVHKVDCYPVAVAREEALILARDLVRAQCGKRWRKTAPALLRHHLTVGTLPEAVSTVAASAQWGTMPSMAEPVTDWITGAVTEDAEMSVKVAAARRTAEASAEASESARPQRQRARQTDGLSRAQKHAKVRRLLTDGKARTTADVARLAGVSESTVDRIKRGIRPVAVKAAVRA